MIQRVSDSSSRNFSSPKSTEPPIGKVHQLRTKLSDDESPTDRPSLTDRPFFGDIKDDKKEPLVKEGTGDSDFD